MEIRAFRPRVRGGFCLTSSRPLCLCVSCEYDLSLDENRLLRSPIRARQGGDRIIMQFFQPVGYGCFSQHLSGLDAGTPGADPTSVGFRFHVFHAVTHADPFSESHDWTLTHSMGVHALLGLAAK